MAEQVEITSFDLRYEGCRMKNKAAEKALLCSISENGIRDPLQGVDTAHGRILLNGFKRYRCARKLQIRILPYSSLGSDEAFGIIELLRIANSRSLSILEQAKLIDELRNLHNMNIAEIAKLLEKSTSWVSMRAGIISQMSPRVALRIFNGEFPVYSYMYTLRQFMRMNCIKKDEIDEFVDLVAGKHLSIRDIELLAHGYFKGGQNLRQQIKNGNIGWGLSRLKHAWQNTQQGLTKPEQSLLRDIEIVVKYMQRVTFKSRDVGLNNNGFHAQANVLCGGILRQADSFVTAIRQLYDRSRETKSHISSL